MAHEERAIRKPHEYREELTRLRNLPDGRARYNAVFELLQELRRDHGLTEVQDYEYVEPLLTSLLEETNPNAD